MRNPEPHKVMTYGTIIKNNNNKPRHLKNIFMKENKYTIYIYVYNIHTVHLI